MNGREDGTDEEEHAEEEEEAEGLLCTTCTTRGARVGVMNTSPSLNKLHSGVVVGVWIFDVVGEGGGGGEEALDVNVESRCAAILLDHVVAAFA